MTILIYVDAPMFIVEKYNLSLVFFSVRNFYLKLLGS